MGRLGKFLASPTSSAAAGAMAAAKARAAASRRGALTIAVSSIQLEPDGLDDLAAGFRLRAHERSKVLGRFAGRRLDPGRGQLLANARPTQKLDQLIVDFCDDVWRRIGGNDDALPDAEVESRNGFGDARNIRRKRRALRRG